MVSKPKPLFTTWQWVTVIGVLVACGVSVTVFGFTTFETKEAHNETMQLLIERLDRIEDKLDGRLAPGVKSSPYHSTNRGK